MLLNGRLVMAMTEGEVDTRDSSTSRQRRRPATTTAAAGSWSWSQSRPRSWVTLLAAASLSLAVLRGDGRHGGVEALVFEPHPHSHTVHWSNSDWSNSDWSNSDWSNSATRIGSSAPRQRRFGKRGRKGAGAACVKGSGRGVCDVI